MTEQPSHYRWQDGDLILFCQLQPKASADEVVGLHGERLKLRITAPPVDGKANEHLLKWFSKLFKVPKSDIDIIQGELGRQKTIRIRQPQQIPKSLLVER